jgi:hypothetical protein
MTKVDELNVPYSKLRARIFEFDSMVRRENEIWVDSHIFKIV